MIRPDVRRRNPLSLSTHCKTSTARVRGVLCTRAPVVKWRRLRAPWRSGLAAINVGDNDGACTASSRQRLQRLSIGLTSHGQKLRLNPRRRRRPPRRRRQLNLRGRFVGVRGRPICSASNGKTRFLPEILGFF